MVAQSGPGWRLAQSLALYVREADRRFPERDRTSDGSIGDLAHASRESDHNPYDGWVHAIDLDEDLARGVTLKPLWDYLIRVRDPRIRYLIYEGRIVKSYNDSAGHKAWVPYPYTGSNAHTQHLHLSINRTSAARNDLRPWGFFRAYPSTPIPTTTPSPTDDEEDEMSAIVYLKNPTTTATHAYHLKGIHAKYCVKEETTNLLKYIGVKETNTRAGAYPVEYQNGLVIVDGPCKNVA